MKTRTDFVSNSSSSSFICCLEDNQFCVLLSKFSVLTFDQYFSRFQYSEISEGYDYVDYKDIPMRAIPDEDFILRFKHGIEGTVPKSAESELSIYLAAKRKADQFSYNDNSVEHSEADKAERKAFVALVEKCKDVLRPTYGSMKFCYAEIEDCGESDVNLELFDCYTIEDLARKRFAYINSIKPLKFMRIISNH